MRSRISKFVPVNKYRFLIFKRFSFCFFFSLNLISDVCIFHQNAFCSTGKVSNVEEDPFLTKMFWPGCLPTSLPVCLPTYLPVCLPTYLPVCLSACLSAHLPVCLLAHLSPVTLPACVSEGILFYCDLSHLPRLSTAQHSLTTAELARKHQSFVLL